VVGACGRAPSRRLPVWPARRCSVPHIETAARGVGRVRNAAKTASTELCTSDTSRAEAHPIERQVGRDPPARMPPCRPQARQRGGPAGSRQLRYPLVKTRATCILKSSGGPLVWQNHQRRPADQPKRPTRRQGAPHATDPGSRGGNGSATGLHSCAGRPWPRRTAPRRCPNRARMTTDGASTCSTPAHAPGESCISGGERGCAPLGATLVASGRRGCASRVGGTFAASAAYATPPPHAGRRWCRPLCTLQRGQHVYLGAGAAAGRVPRGGRPIENSLHPRGVHLLPTPHGGARPRPPPPRTEKKGQTRATLETAPAPHVNAAVAAAAAAAINASSSS